MDIHKQGMHREKKEWISWAINATLTPVSVYLSPSFVNIFSLAPKNGGMNTLFVQVIDHHVQWMEGGGDRNQDSIFNRNLIGFLCVGSSLYNFLFYHETFTTNQCNKLFCDAVKEAANEHTSPCESRNIKYFFIYNVLEM